MADSEKGNTQIAVLGGGCFWCLEAAYEGLAGVLRVEPGYAGGHVEDPSYKQVCTGTTGHAEVVRITYDPDRTSYRRLLEVFFRIHDPTTPDRQGGDVGPQYRSIILYASPEQQATAEGLIAELEEAGVWTDRIVTQLAPLDEFYVAEPEHHQYFRRNPERAYCQLVIRPKLDKLQRFLESAAR